MKRIIICFLCLALLCGCAGKTDTKVTSKITVVTTVFPLYDFVRAIVGDNVEIKMLIRPGNEVHSYDPLPSDMMAVYDSDLFVYIGGESEKWVDTLIDDAEINSLSLIEITENEHHHHEGHSHGHDHTDEHIWTSPENAILMLNSICDSLCAADSKNSDVYKQNCKEYIARISEASAKTESVVSQFDNPFILVADRFPFAYFAEEYNIKYEAAFDGCAVSTDISLKTMLRLTETIEKRDIKAVFCTELSSRNIANALNEQLGVEVIELHSAHNVTSDDLNAGITYVDILYRNIEALERGLS